MAVKGKKDLTGVFVLTRFAIQPDSELSIFPNATEDRRYVNRNWLETRLNRLVKFTIPSLENQTDTTFMWFVGADAAVPRDIIERLKLALPSFAILLETSSKNTFNSTVTNLLGEEIGTQITVRLDSDDALNASFIENVKRACNKDGIIFNFPVGLGFFVDQGIAVRKFIKSSPFIFTRGDPANHILQFGIHSGVGEKAHLKEIRTSQPMWLKVYSPEMTSNLPRNGFATLMAPTKLLSRYFGMKSEIVDTTLLDRLKFTYSFLGRIAGHRFPVIKKLWHLVHEKTVPKDFSRRQRHSKY